MKTLTYIITALLITVFLSVNQEGKAQMSDRQEVQRLISDFEYVKAIALYKDMFTRTNPESEDIRNLAYCYLQTNNTNEAIEWISKLATVQNPARKDVLIYAHLLKTEAQYDEAAVQYKRYKALAPDDKNADLWIESCVASKKWMESPKFFKVENVEALNSENSDFGAAPVGEGLVFTSDRKHSDVLRKSEIYGWTGNAFLKLYYVNSREKLSDYKFIDQLNAKYHNGPALYTSKSDEIFFTRTKMVKAKKYNLNNDPTSWIENVESPDYENRLEIYSASCNGGTWDPVTPFAYNNPEYYSVGHPAISPDGNTLYFVSDMPGGYGGTDIYYCIKNDNNTWGYPVNAGNKINTEGKEVFPFVDNDGTLYFSSDGHPGMGGLDIFKSTGSKKNWSAPENLKYPINSSKDDFSVVFTKESEAGYLSSNRDGGKGSDDIYSFEFSPPVNLMLIVKINEIDEKNNIVPLNDVDLNLKTMTTEDVNSVDGMFITPIKCDENYTILGSKEGYFSKSKVIDTKCYSYNDTIYAELILDKLKVGKPIVLKNIFYDFDKWNIRPDAEPDLNILTQIMIDNPDIIVELGSHTDSRGSDNYNMKLSEKRAKSAVQYIKSKGIDNNRISYKGYGESVHLNECSNDVPCSEDAHQLNRRTEFKVVGFINGQKTIIKSK